MALVLVADEAIYNHYQCDYINKWKSARRDANTVHWL